MFSVALPDDSLFAPLCPGGLPGGVYSPAIDDGYYVRLNPLSPGARTLQIHAENVSAQFLLDVTYYLDIVPVIQR